MTRSQRALRETTPAPTARVWAWLLLLLAAPLHADTLELADGSRLSGELVRMDGAVVVFRTKFAGELSIDRQSVVGLATGQSVVAQLPDGSRLVGQLRHNPETGRQSVRTELVGDVPVLASNLASVWQPGQPSPEERAVQVAHDKEVAELKARHREPSDLWSGAIAAGFSGSDGNTNKHSMHGKLETKRETDFDRLTLGLRGRSATDQGKQTEAEVIGTAGLERDFSGPYFAFGETGFERDRFEGIDLRATLTGGVGRFLIREKDHEWKVRSGVGYRFEAPRNGENDGEFIVALGHDYWIRLLNRTRIGHKLTYLPTIAAPGTDYRIESEFGIRHPLAGPGGVDIGFGLLHQYDALPPEGVKKLDTQYNFSIGYTFE